MGTTNGDSQDVGREVDEIGRRDRLFTNRMYIAMAIFAVVSLVIGFAILMNTKFQIR